MKRTREPPDGSQERASVRTRTSHRAVSMPWTDAPYLETFSQFGVTWEVEGGPEQRDVGLRKKSKIWGNLLQLGK